MGGGSGTRELSTPVRLRGVSADTLTAIRLEHAARPWTTNAERKHGHWAARASLVSEWRTAFRLLAHHGPAFTWVHVTAEPWQKGGRLQDTGACHPAVKAAIDGIVDAGLLPDDSPEYVRMITYLAPQRGKDALVLHVQGPTGTN